MFGRLTAVFSLAILTFSLIAASAFAQAPPQIMQQGRLLDDDGEPVSGTVTMQFTLYNAASAGEILWQDEVDVDIDDSGFYSVTLGDQGSPLTADIFALDATWLAVAIDGGDELSPRMAFNSVPYSLASAFAERAAVADQVAAGSITSESFAEEALQQALQDTAASISCATGQVPVASDSGWDCGDVSGLTIVEVQDAIGTSLGSLNCAADEVPRFDGADWQCAPQRTYQAGAHLALDGDTFSVTTDFLTPQQADQDYLSIDGGTLDGDLVVRERIVQRNASGTINDEFRERNTTRLVVKNSDPLNTIAIPMDPLHDLCHDGCFFILSRNIVSEQNGISSVGPLPFSYDKDSGRWRQGTNATGTAGNHSEYDGASYGRIVPGPDLRCCGFREQGVDNGQYLQDSTKEVFLHNDRHQGVCSPSSEVECTITFFD